ncbi:hypothetical protein Syun_003563 [Stephania yunnanensis]|uniref:Uncharacterized protein n=1 Tax=Stephania yunnanensis TaxID=152371 RepID=A0AAP0L1P1_9MAGN
MLSTMPPIAATLFFIFLISSPSLPLPPTTTTTTKKNITLLGDASIDDNQVITLTQQLNPLASEEHSTATRFHFLMQKQCSRFRHHPLLLLNHSLPFSPFRRRPRLLHRLRPSPIQHLSRLPRPP